MSVYTVRVQKTDVSHTLPCAQYTVTSGDRKVLTLYSAEGSIRGQVPVLTVPIDEDTPAVFIMNQQGNTVDTIRYRPPQPGRRS